MCAVLKSTSKQTKQTHTHRQRIKLFSFVFAACLRAGEKPRGNYSLYHINWYFPYWYWNHQHDKLKEKEEKFNPQKIHPAGNWSKTLTQRTHKGYKKIFPTGKQKLFISTSMERSKPFFSSSILLKMLVIRKSLKSLIWCDLCFDISIWLLFKISTKITSFLSLLHLSFFSHFSSRWYMKCDKFNISST